VSFEQKIPFRLIPLIFIAAAACSGLSRQARAAITVLDYYRMGEDDTGLVQQGAATGTTRDSVGTNHLSLPGAPVYENDTSSSAAAHVGSSFSLDFLSGGAYGIAPALHPL